MFNIFLGMVWIGMAFWPDPPTDAFHIVPWFYMNIFFIVGGVGLLALGIKQIKEE